MPYSVQAPPQDEATQRHIAREKSSYITKTARSVTAANLVAPILCYIMFAEDADPLRFKIWLAYMFVATAIRTWTTGRLEHEAEKIANPRTNLNWVTLGVGLIGLGWGLGWLLLVPDLSMENRLLYLYITTGGMFNSMFAYCVHWPTFYSFTLPIVVPAIAAIVMPPHIFHWTVAVGLVTLFVYVFRIARNFSTTYEDSLRLRLRNELLYHDLAAERDASVAANVAKSNFIAVASHDLRQPLHAINIYLDSLHMNRIEAGEQETIHKIKNSITVLNDMFEALLNISRLDSYTFRPSNSDFRLHELRSWLDEIARPLAVRKQLDLQFSAMHGIVHGDIKVMQQIVMNLLSNAIFYTDQGQVRVDFSKEQGCLTVRVRDTGCGIAAEDQAQIFDEFYRVNRTRALHDGLGLGLSIVKRLCALIDANIELQSQPDHGTLFTLKTSYPMRDEGAEIAMVVAPAPTRMLSDPLQGKVVAVIEDDPVVCQAYRQTLSRHGAVVVVLSEEPRRMQEELSTLDRIDLIISDYRLKSSRGDQVIQQLRESFNEEVPAMIVTADTAPAHIEYFMDLRVPVLHKPVSFRHVVATAERLLQEQAQAAGRLVQDGHEITEDAGP